MTGRVSALEARISFQIRGPSASMLVVDAIVDTGFTAWLTLPRATIDYLGLEWLHERRAQLADGSTISFNVFAARVLWNRRVLSIHVDEAENTPLVGMSLLNGCELKMDVRPMGKVSIKPLAVR